MEITSTLYSLFRIVVFQIFSLQGCCFYSQIILHLQSNKRKSVNRSCHSINGGSLEIMSSQVAGGLLAVGGLVIYSQIVLKSKFLLIFSFNKKRSATPPSLSATPPSLKCPLLFVMKVVMYATWDRI